jgi:hypothetical protein
MMDTQAQPKRWWTTWFFLVRFAPTPIILLGCLFLALSPRSKRLSDADRDAIVQQVLQQIVVESLPAEERVCRLPEQRL